MSKSLNHIRKIEEYISGELTPEHRNEFEKKLLSDSDLQDELNVTQQVIEGIQASAFKEQLKEVHKELFGGS